MMYFVESLVRSLDENDGKRVAFYLERLKHLSLSQGRPLVPPHLYWIIVARQPEAAKYMVLEEEEDCGYGSNPGRNAISSLRYL